MIPRARFVAPERTCVTGPPRSPTTTPTNCVASAHAGQTTGYDYDALGRKTLQNRAGQRARCRPRTGRPGRSGAWAACARTRRATVMTAKGRLKTLTTTGAGRGGGDRPGTTTRRAGQMTFKGLRGTVRGPELHVLTLWTAGPRARGARGDRGRPTATTTRGGWRASRTRTATTLSASYTYDRLGPLGPRRAGAAVRGRWAYQGNTSLLASETSTAGAAGRVCRSTPAYDGLLRRTSLQVAQGQTNFVSQSFGFGRGPRGLASASQGTASAAYGYWLDSAAKPGKTLSRSATAGQAVMDHDPRLMTCSTGWTSTVSQVNGGLRAGERFTATATNAANERVRADVAGRRQPLGVWLRRAGAGDQCR